ncbi:MAG: DUF3108 domain-containing protein [Comamonadaceae bacterium]|nr:DUF3108 domain-containing protein [Comamonadaceae bacterium]
MSPAAIPRPTLWLLLAAVLALHLLALRSLPVRPAAGTHGATPVPLSTRLLPPPKPAAPTAAPPVRPAPVRAPTRSAPRRPAARTPRPAPAPPAPPAAAVSTTAIAEPASPATETDMADALAQIGGYSAPEPPATTHAEAPEAETAPQTPASEAVAERPAEAPGHPVALPPSAQLAFKVQGHVKGFDYNASAELAWQNDGERYRVRQKVSAFLLGSRAQESVGRVSARGLQPERFVDEGRKTRSADIDIAAHTAHFSDGASSSATVDDGAQDRLSVFIQLGALLAASPADYPSGTEIALQVVGARRVDRWTFRVEGPETLELPIGTTPALKLRRLPQGDDAQQDELWLGTDIGYLPVRIRLAQGESDYVDLRLAQR